MSRFVTVDLEFEEFEPGTVASKLIPIQTLQKARVEGACASGTEGALRVLVTNVPPKDYLIRSLLTPPVDQATFPGNHAVDESVSGRFSIGPFEVIGTYAAVMFKADEGKDTDITARISFFGVD